MLNDFSVSQDSREKSLKLLLILVLMKNRQMWLK